ncbi:hypothetical protein BDV98DRAFT_593331 [Pterulicium gracile]|uniref:Peptidase S9 prolyl oligopeptidase catalytic domain-containing protein n=1 Tax=Pterulicium gracile TaxID=1884261 RepID=A0A5C3QJC8_9AGAR|nr:hypothetical protein BDV98DRAFT_593331 [Pterula gracilis]
MLFFSNWSVVISTQFNVIGPFPIHAREQHILSPSFPLLDLTSPPDLTHTFPSSYADGGFVSWSSTNFSAETGDIKVSFPDVRWDNLRHTEGWAALQHHALLHGKITVSPPPASELQGLGEPRLSVKLSQGAYFAVLPRFGDGSGNMTIEGVAPKWYSGNIYAFPHALPRTVELPIPPSRDGPTEYELFIAGDYEIRLFGDSAVYESPFPIQSLNLNVTLEDPLSSTTNSSEPEFIVHEPEQDIICDFVAGHAFGDTIGVGLRSVVPGGGRWWTVSGVSGMNETQDSLAFSLPHPVRLIETQFQLVPITIQQTSAISEDTTEVNLELTLTRDDNSTESGADTQVISISIPIIHRPLWNETHAEAIKTSFLWMDAVPAAFLATPPVQSEEGVLPPLLGLHGAGVEIFDAPFWSDAVPRKERRWIVLPTGGTSWGLDWHGPSALQSLQAVDALARILTKQGSHAQMEENTPVILLGHSNGGQGAWWIAARNPDRVLAVAAAAGYIKSQSYIPWTMSRSQRYTDPALQAVLETSLTADNNELFLTNLVNKQVMGIHGGIDNNVPTWHSREYVSVIKTWDPETDIEMREVPGENHWFDTVIDNEVVQAFFDRAPSNISEPTREFTLTVSIPSESGSLHGWRVRRLSIPGRLGRIRVQSVEGVVKVKTTNIKVFSVHGDHLPEGLQGVEVDGSTLALLAFRGEVAFARGQDGNWMALDSLPPIPRSGRLQAILSSSGAPTRIVVPDTPTSHELSIAQRLAHDLYMYFGISPVNVVTSSELLQGEAAGPGNLIVVGSSERNEYATDLLGRGTTPLKVEESGLVLEGRKLSSDEGAIFLHPHPDDQASVALFILGSNEAGLERALRLFPIRTALPGPDFVVIGPEADELGAGGVRAAGVWGDEWSWNGAMSWVD